MHFLRKNTLFAVCFTFLSSGLFAQRSYKSHSVLSAGSWYKISVNAAGVYKMDAAFLNALGISGSIPSAQLRIFGQEGGMLPENNAQPRVDDLEELAIQVVDGGDGVINGSDYVLFYASGPDQWKVDAASQKFIFSKNLYSDRSFYFISLAGNGKRINTLPILPGPTVTVTSFNERYAYELDTVNFLESGKQWYGEEFSNLPGHLVSRQFSVPSPNVVLSSPLSLTTTLAARSVNATSRFDVFLNSQPVHQSIIPGVAGGINDPFAQEVEQTTAVAANQAVINVGFTFFPGSFNAQGWINRFQVFFRRQLAMVAGQQLAFRDWSSVGNSAVQFKIANSDAAVQVWDVTDPFNNSKMQGSLSGTDLSFTANATNLREYIAFGNSFLLPAAVGKVSNQDLHNTVETDYIIVTHPGFTAQAQSIAQFHQQREGLRTVIVTTDQVFNEFASGIPDPGAIRDFVKMYYDKYRLTWANSGKYLLLLGRGSFDYKNRVANNTNFVTVYESISSLDPLSSYTSDDFFGFLDDNEDINSSLITNTLDIGIGRLPVRNSDEAQNFVSKLNDYHAPQSFGPWRNNIDFIADDEDFNLHLQDAEVISATTTSVLPVMNLTKIYLDAFRQEGSTAGGSYPQANAAVNSNIYNGTLIWNYSGHGGPPRLAEEVILDQQIVNNWNNPHRLPLFVTATCDFAPYDHPSVFSLGENLLVRPKTGAIALMTTTRVVFSYSNRIMNDNYLRFALQPDPSGRYKTLGESMVAGKNYTYLNSPDIINNRKFTLLGDPAMTLAFPKQKVRATMVNNKPVSGSADTLSATEYATIDGEVIDNNGARINNFNGIVYLTLFDKPQTITTLGNDATSLPAGFQTQTSALFKGKASATNGVFSFKFRLPKDINYQYGNGKISLYAQDSTRDGNGFSTNVLIGGIAPGAITDKEGPVIKGYLNDEKFVNGSMTNSTPVLILKLSDSSGINTGTAGVDHDIIATVDGDNRKYFVLNDFYEADLNSYQKGEVRFQLPAFTPGHHTLHIKAWDVVNNSGEYDLDFTITNDNELVLDHVLNYPNPFTTKTSFWFEHNKPGQDLRVKVEIFTISGKLIKTLSETINNEGSRSSDIQWDGRDNYGNKIGRGVYLYRLTVMTADGKKASKFQRLVSLL